MEYWNLQRNVEFVISFCGIYLMISFSGCRVINEKNYFLKISKNEGGLVAEDR